MPWSGAARTISRSASIPARCPAARGRLWARAQRPLPSMMMATWAGVRRSSKELCIAESPVKKKRLAGKDAQARMAEILARGLGGIAHQLFQQREVIQEAAAAAAGE